MNHSGDEGVSHFVDAGQFGDRLDLPCQAINQEQGENCRQQQCPSHVSKEFRCWDAALDYRSFIFEFGIVVDDLESRREH